MKWTDEEIEILKKFYPKLGDEITINELSKVLGRTRDAICNKAQRIGVAIENQSNIDYELLEQLDKRITL